MGETDSNKEISTKQLNEALEAGSTEAEVQEMLNSGAKPNTHSFNLAIKKDYEDVAKQMLNTGVIPDKTSLNWSNDSQSSSSEEMILRVLEHVDPDIYDLVKALEKGREAVAKSILEKHAENFTPFEVAMVSSYLNNGLANCSKDILKNILDSKLKLDLSNVCTVAHRGNDFEDIASRMLDKILVQESDKKSTKTLKFLSEYGSELLVKKILDLKVEPNTEILNIVLKRGFKGAAQQMLSLGAKPDTESLNLAFKNNFTDMIKGMLNSGAKPNLITLSYASRADLEDIVKCIEGLGVTSNTANLNSLLSERIGPYLNQRIGSEEEFINIILNLQVAPNTETLNLALERGFGTMFQELLRLRVEPDTKTLNLALKKRIKFPEIADYMLNRLNSGAIKPDTETLNIALKNRIKFPEIADYMLSRLNSGAIKPDTETLNIALKNRIRFPEIADYMLSRLNSGAIKPDTKTLNIALEKKFLGLAEKLWDYGIRTDEERFKSFKEHMSSKEELKKGLQFFTSSKNKRQGEEFIIKKVLSVHFNTLSNNPKKSKKRKISL